MGSHLVKWNARHLGREVEAVKDYYPGYIVSVGDVEIIGEARQVLNEASKIIAGRDIKLKGEIEVRSLVSKYIDSVEEIAGF